MGLADLGLDLKVDLARFGWAGAWMVAQFD